jgi:NAD(P) transhydrogenase subunit alpha
MDIQTIMLLLFIFIIAAFLGIELISKVPSQLHTPLMSGTNAISGITIVGAIASTAINTAQIFNGGNFADVVGIILGVLAVFFATINVMGGYFVTDRMLGMFKKKGDK